MISSQKVLPFVIFSLPLQLNKYFFVNSSLVFGIPIDYRAIVVYLSDLLILVYLALFFYEKRKLTQHFKNHKIFFATLLILNAYIISSGLVFSDSKLLTIYFGIKVLEFSLFTYALSIHLSKKDILQAAKKILILASLFQSFIIVLQFGFQKSTGLWFLGERSFDTSTPSIAHTYILDKQLLRAYGTFPHPNVAACFLLITQIFVLERAISSRKKLKTIEKVFLVVTFLAIVLTFSKIALFLEVLLLAFYLKKLKLLIPFIFIAGAMFFKSLTQTSFVYSVAERLLLLQASLNITLQNPFFGVGSLNFISNLALENIITTGEVRLLQPVHNVFFLIMAENGTIGLLLFAILFIALQKNLLTVTKIFLFFTIVLYLSVDHFLWTLQQGQLILFFSIAYILSYTKEETS